MFHHPQARGWAWMEKGEAGRRDSTQAIAPLHTDKPQTGLAYVFFPFCCESARNPEQKMVNRNQKRKKVVVRDKSQQQQE